MERSESIKELITALAKAQLAFQPIIKTEKVDYQTTQGRKRYNYAPLNEVIDAVKKGLSDNGLAVIQATKIEDNKLYLENYLCHSSGEWVKSEMFVGDISQSPQVEGSALTYKRRYSLSAILNIASEEDDDAQASEAEAEKKQTEKPVAKSPDKPVSSQNEQEKAEHFCKVHNVKFFKTEKMRSWAHMIEGTQDWCYEGHKEEKTVEETKSNPDAPANKKQLEQIEKYVTIDGFNIRAIVDDNKWAVKSTKDLTEKQAAIIIQAYQEWKSKQQK